MKRLLAMALAISFVCTLAPAPAQASLGAFLTWWDAGDADSGFGGGAKIKIPLIPIVSLDVRASYIGFDNDLSTVPIEAVGSLNFGIINAGISLGYYMWSAKDLNASDEVGGSIWAGVSLGLGGVGVFGELRYNMAKTTITSDAAPGETELSADGISLNLGVNF